MPSPAALEDHAAHHGNPVRRIVGSLRTAHDAGAAQPRQTRERQLQRLHDFLCDKEAAIGDALKRDLGKCFVEAYGSEIGFLKGEINHSLKRLEGWMKPRRVRAPLLVQPARSEIHSESLGVVLIIAPWNYPLHLTLAPLISALAAGNCAVLKPSELAPAMGDLMAKELPKYLDPQLVQVVQGGPSVTQELLAQRFDHIFFTGSGRVGRIVYAAAVKNLTPVTLELGGKSPVIVDKDVDLRVASRRIALGRFLNAGQTCVAPDYALVHEAVYEDFLCEVQGAVLEFFGKHPEKSDDFGRIVSESHLDRLLALLEGQQVVIGGQHARPTRYLAPTVLRDVSPEASVMKEEVFGPILPVLKVSGTDAAIDFINQRDRPLALYVFTASKSTADRVIASTRSGSVAVNQTVYQLAVPELPFGGIGESGFGSYHGHYGFLTFSHQKAVLRKPLSLDLRMFYPPYVKAALPWLRRLIG